MNFKIVIIVFFIIITGVSKVNSQNLWTPKPHANFTLSNGEWVNCDGTIVSFLDSSFIIDSCNAVGDYCDSIIEWKWLFGDGYTSNLKNPIEDYSKVIFETGSFNVILKIKTKYGYTDSITRSIYLAQTKVLFRVVYDTIVQIGDSVVFENLSSFGNSKRNKAIFKYDFGDGEKFTDSLNRTFIKHRYSKTGIYEVYLEGFQYWFPEGKNIICSDYFPDTFIKEKKVNINVNDNLKISDNSRPQYYVFPNPAKDYIFIKGITKGEIIIYDIFGKEILRTLIGDMNSIEISMLSKGLYNIKFNEKGINYNKLFFKY